MVQTSRLLYLSHIDWRWIKQRPQFLAEGLAEHYEVLVAYRRAWRRRVLVDERSALRRSPIWRLPFRRFRLSSGVTRLLERKRIGLLSARFQPDVLWLCSPSFYESLPRGLLPRAKLVYDCMDEPSSLLFPHERERVCADERSLLREADLVLASSARLASRARTLGAAAGRVKLVRNAFGGPILPPRRAPLERSGRVRIGYAGTIGAWIDFDLIVECLGAVPEVEFHFLGPLEEEAHPPRHPRLFIHDPVPHARVAGIARKWDAAVMPFRRSNLTESVDPVKLYEYINLDLPIIATFLDELGPRFGPFVDFYRTPSEFVKSVRRLGAGGCIGYGPGMRESFLSCNAWGSRVESIRAALAAL